MVESREIEQVKRQRPQLESKFRALELKAMKENGLKLAKAKIATAKKEDIDDYAPKTLKKASDELSLAESMINVNRSNTGKSEEHARQALYLVGQSYEIAEIIKDFKRRDFSHEDMFLWYQNQLTKVVSGLSNVDTSFDGSVKTRRQL